MSIEFTCTADAHNSTIFNHDEELAFVSVELELNDGETHMTLMSLEDAEALRDWLCDNL